MSLKPSSASVVIFLLATAAAAPPAGAGLPDLTLEKVADVPDAVYVTHAGDDRLFVTRLFGHVMIVEDGELLPEPFLDITDRVGRVFSIAFHPDYESNGYFFVHRVEPETPASLITRFRVSEDDPNRADPASEVILVRIPKAISLHFGGQLAFGPDGYLYVSTGDTNDVTPDGALLVDPECGPQTVDRLEGKILRLDVDRNVDRGPYYAIPPDNPLRGAGRPEIWALGLRNPWRFAVDRETGDLWIADVGLDDREEVNFQPASSPGGENYGWKVMEGTSCLGDTSGCVDPVPACGSPAFTPPVIEYSHDGGRCSVIGGPVYRGRLVPGLYGHYLYADLCAGTLWAATKDGDVVTTRELPFSMPDVLSFGEDVDGEVYLMAEHVVHRLADPTVPEAGVLEFTSTSVAAAENSLAAEVGLYRSGEGKGEVGVEVRRAGGTAGDEDVPFGSATVSWADGETGEKVLTIPLTDDFRDEADETARLELAGPTGGAILGARASAELRVLDDDEPLCVADETHLCLSGGRFRISVTWRTADGLAGSGRAVSLGEDSGSFWFFSADNPEIFVKLLDACFDPFQHYWVFAAGLTNVATTLEVVDTATGLVRRYPRPLGVPFEAIQDTSAFATCP